MAWNSGTGHVIGEVNDKALLRKGKSSCCSAGWTYSFSMTRRQQRLLQSLSRGRWQTWRPHVLGTGSSHLVGHQNPWGASWIKFLTPASGDSESTDLWQPLGICIFWTFQLILIISLLLKPLESMKAWEILRWVTQQGLRGAWCNYFWNPESLWPFLA